MGQRPNTSSAPGLSKVKSRGIKLLVLKSQQSNEALIVHELNETREQSTNKIHTQTMSRSSKLRPLSLKDIDGPPTLYEALTPKQMDADFTFQQPQCGILASSDGRQSRSQSRLRRSQVRSSGGLMSSETMAIVATVNTTTMAQMASTAVKNTTESVQNQHRPRKQQGKVILSTAMRASSMLPRHDQQQQDGPRLSLARVQLTNMANLLPRQQLSMSQIKRPFKQQRTKITKSSILRVKRDLELADQQLQLNKQMSSLMQKNDHQTISQPMMQQNGQNTIAPHLNSSITFQQVGSSAARMHSSQPPNQEQQPSLQNQQYFLQEKILSQFQLQTQDLFQSPNIIFSPPLNTKGLQKIATVNHINSMHRISEGGDFVSDSQNIGERVGSQYSEQMFPSSNMFGGKIPDARYPPEMTLIESNEVPGSHPISNMTIRTNAAKRGLMSKQQSWRPGPVLSGSSSHTSPTFNQDKGPPKRFSTQPRNMTPNILVASRLRSPQATPAAIFHKTSLNRQVSTSGGQESVGINPQEHQPVRLQSNRCTDGGGPSTTIFVNETSLINKDLEMVEASANLVRQRSIEMPQVPTAAQHHRKNVQSNAPHFFRGANSVYVASNYGKIINTEPALSGCTQLTGSRAKQNSYQHQKRGRRESIVLQEVTPQLVSVRIGGSNYQYGPSKVARRNCSNDLQATRTLESNQQTNLIIMESYQSQERKKLDPILDTSINLKDKNESVKTGIKSENPANTNNRPTSHNNMRNTLLGMFTKQEAQRKSQIVTRNSNHSRSRSPTTGARLTPTNGNRNTSQGNSTVKRGLSQAGEDLDKVIDQYHAEKSIIQSRNANKMMAQSSIIVRNIQKKYSTLEDSRCCSSLSKRESIVGLDCTQVGSEASRMKHRFSTNKHSDCQQIEQQNEMGSQRNGLMRSHNISNTNDDFGLIDQLKSRINRNFDNFKMLLSLENQDGKEKKLLQRMTVDAIQGTSDGCSSTLSPTVQFGQVNATSDGNRQNFLMTHNHESFLTNSSSSRAVGDLAVALQKFKRAYKDKQEGDKSNQTTMLPSPMRVAADQPAQRKNSKFVPYGRGRTNDRAFDSVQRALSHQRSQETWNAKFNLKNQQKKGTAGGVVRQTNIIERRSRTNQMHSRERKFVSKHLPNSDINGLGNSANVSSQDYIYENHDTTRINNAQSMSPPGRVFEFDKTNARRSSMPTQQQNSKITIAEHMLSQQRASQSTTLQNSLLGETITSVVDGHQGSGNFKNDNLIIKSINKQPFDPSQTIIVPTIIPVDSEPRFRQQRNKKDEIKNSSEMVKDTFSIVTQEEICGLSKESSLVVADYNNKQETKEVDGVGSHHKVVLPTVLDTRNTFSPNVSKQTVHQSRKTDQDGNLTPCERSFANSVIGDEVNINQQGLLDMSSYNFKNCNIKHGKGNNDASSQAVASTPKPDGTTTMVTQPASRRVIQNRARSSHKNSVSKSFIKVRDEAPRSSSLIGANNMPITKVQLNSKSTEPSTNPPLRMNRTKNKSIQFNRLPSYMQKKYIELFRPKEIQDMMTSGALKASLLESSSHYQNTTTIGALTQEDTPIQPTVFYDSHGTKRESSQSMLRTKQGKFRHRKFVMGHPKEANLTSLLKNVNFFKAEKQLLSQKGMKQKSKLVNKDIKLTSFN